MQQSLLYAETHSRGFTLVTLTHQKHRGRFLYVDTVASRRYRLAKCDEATYTEADPMRVRGGCPLGAPIEVS